VALSCRVELGIRHWQHVIVMVDPKEPQQSLRMKGFDPKWCKWIQEFISRDNVRIKVNNDIDNYFQTRKGLRQGDPLSPILFNIIVDNACNHDQ
jgi:hypothetical protein